MTIYTGPVFDMAAQQFHLIANHLDIPEDERPRLLYPKRAIAVSCPIHRDDGTTAVFQGYRVQHHLTHGPDEHTEGRCRVGVQPDRQDVVDVSDDPLELIAFATDGRSAEDDILAARGG